jgi:hypothetical protein
MTPSWYEVKVDKYLIFFASARGFAGKRFQRRQFAQCVKEGDLCCIKRTGNSALKTRSSTGLTARSRQGDRLLPPLRFLRKIQLN